MKKKEWIPLNPEKIKEIKRNFNIIYPQKEYGKLSEKIGSYWIELLRENWEKKELSLKKKDLSYNEEDPLSRLKQNTVVIAYADSIKNEDEKTLITLDNFLRNWFPAIKGLHILPACSIEENRFNDGYFSQIERNNIHSAFGTNEIFADLAKKYFFMNDLVMGHVDINNPIFKKYLNGDDIAGRNFYVFTTSEYERMKAEGCFNKIFRPRPFPLFTIFRRQPLNERYRSLTFSGKIEVMMKKIEDYTGIIINAALIQIMYLFAKIKNDQMLLDEDYNLILDFLNFLKSKGIEKDKLFTESKIQEVSYKTYIFIEKIKNIYELLCVCGYSEKDAEEISKTFSLNEKNIFGEEVRVLTTFSHVQVDVNTSTFEGLTTLANDLMWYLTKDLNMLRLDAVNYAFKKWGTSCFGLSELDHLLKIIYLSMECISPCIIPNLEVNDSLTTILKQMNSKIDAPPMMHDFFLASLLPLVYHQKKPDIIGRIFEKFSQFKIPHNSIRFSLSESHDGKSVRGSSDLLSFEERMILAKAVTLNGGFIKYKSVSVRKTSRIDLIEFCTENKLDFSSVQNKIFDIFDKETFTIKNGISCCDDVKAILGISEERLSEITDFFFKRIFEGREPYELCVSTKDSLPPVDNVDIEVERFLSFETLAFAIMGRNIKTIYFNDLLALPNDYNEVKKSGELRNIKRTKLNLQDTLLKLKDKNSFQSKISIGINNLIALVDSDPALNFRGNEAEYVKLSDNSPVAVIRNQYKNNKTITVVNLSGEIAKINLALDHLVYDNISHREIAVTNGFSSIELQPFSRLWLTEGEINIDPLLLRH